MVIPRNIENRKKAILAMEYLARSVNYEDLFYNIWLSEGVPDGDIPFGSLDLADVADCLVEDDDTFDNIMETFLKVMYLARGNGDLFFDT